MKQNKSTQGKGMANHSTSSSKRFKIICTSVFLEEAKRLAKKHPHIRNDFFTLRDQLRIDPVTGNDSLGNDMYKVRMPISDTNKGQSGGARVIIQVKLIDKTVYILSVYSKSEISTIIDSALQKLLKRCNLKMIFF
jgi:mRNA-degrading endonuclease RelE of RelBE toxin-antitoxin system